MNKLQHLKEAGLSLNNKRKGNAYKSAFYSLVVFGDKFVGKTSLIKRFLDKSFTHEYNPTIDDVYEKIIPGELNETFRIYDTAGSIEFPAMNRLTIFKIRRMYYCILS